MKKRLILAYFLVVATLGGLAAQTVQVLLMQDVPKGQDFAGALSEFIVNGSLDALFESGLIGTNERPVDGDAVRFEAYRPEASLKEAYISHVLVILARYPDEASGRLVPDCSYRLVTVGDGKTLLQGSLPALVPESGSVLDAEKACSGLGTAIVRSCAGAW